MQAETRISRVGMQAERETSCTGEGDSKKKLEIRAMELDKIKYEMKVLTTKKQFYVIDVL